MDATSLLLLFVAMFAASTYAMSTGPVIQDACALLEPMHAGQTPYTTEFPGTISVFPPDTETYELGATLQILIQAGGSLSAFRGFMIQAREAGQELSGVGYGTFSTINDDPKTQSLTCFSLDDTAGHSNADEVQQVIVLWSATDLPVSQIQFYVTIVERFHLQYWARVSSGPLNISDTGVTPQVTTEQPTPESDRNYSILKSHGSLMIFAWTVFVPVGIIMALFYKVIWPNGEWFYSHIAIMCAAILLVIAGLAMAIWHAKGLWLTTTSLNNPHQVLGIIAAVAIAANPFLAIIRCDPSSQWRFLYNWSHGLIGLILAQGVALAAVLLGLNVMRELPGLQLDFIHYAVYMASASVGLIISILIFYNLYAVNYSKNFQPTGSQIGGPSTSEPPGSFPEYTYDDDENKESSRDYPLRAGVGITIIVLLLVFALLAVIFIGLA